MLGIGQRFVYILRSRSDRSKHYVGVTGDVENRLDWHNHGPSGQTMRWCCRARLEPRLALAVVRHGHDADAN